MTMRNNATHRTTMNGFAIAVAIALIFVSAALPAAAEEPYPHPATRDYPNNVYWGDTHIHTYLSGDAVFELSPDDAYRFARGEAVTGNSKHLFLADLVHP